MSLIKTTREQVLVILKAAKDAGIGADLSSRDMAFVDLFEVDFDGARLDGASLDGASLVGARLVGASLVGARLVGASLDGASLDGASLVGASLVGARLVGASLVGARLVGASLDGASLDGASLVGARLDGASLDGASPVGARLDGASLVGARLDGARLDGASLVGASLDGASLDGASLARSFVLGLVSMPWTASVSPTTMKLGCQIHPHDAWESFTDGQIADMASGALDFWKTWKPILMPLCRAAREWLAVVQPPAQEGAEPVRMPLDTWLGQYGQHRIRWTASGEFTNAAYVRLEDGVWRGRYWAQNEAKDKWAWVDVPTADQPGVTACMLAVEDAARTAGVVLPGVEPTGEPTEVAPA